jgi:uncharacterized repeat protein (TIGR03803 family)
VEKLRLLKVVGIVLAFSIASAMGLPAQTFTTVVSFDVTNGANPQSSLIQATDGNFYGTVVAGGASQGCGSAFGCGAVFKITPTGTLTDLYSFCSQPSCTDGDFPVAGLIQGTDGNFYGTTSNGGSSSNCDLGCGTVFMLTPAGALTTLYSFSGPDGDMPYTGSLVYGLDGNFYGTTAAGGANGNYGTVFMYNTTAGTLTTIYSFCSLSGCTDGYAPFSGLVLGTDGNFYGTTYFGGANNGGTAFLITPGGVLTTLYNFCSQASCTDGVGPYGGLMQGLDGNFYGTSELGGANELGTVFQINSAVQPPALTTLYSFAGSDGSYPQAGVIQASDGNFYGVTTEGGANGDGTAFEITSSGALTTLYSFCFQSGCTDGEGPYGELAQVSTGTIYGTTYFGGASDDCYTGGCGTLFSLSLGLPPFVETQLTSGKVGASVVILGLGLKGATSVSFNGTETKFTAKNSEIKTKVPAGATTGNITVTLAGGGKLNTKVPFRVRPRIKSFSPKSGPVGEQVKITGVSLSQTTGVSFGAVPATEFKVDSDTEVTATVPAGAKTGTITISTSGGTAASTKKFTVTE